MDYIVHGILQARILEWVAFPFARGSSWLRDRTQVSHIAGGSFYQLSHKGSPRVLQRVSYPFSSGSSRPKNRTGVSCIAGIFFTNWAIREFLIDICQQFINHVSFGETFWQGFFKWTFPTVPCVSSGWEGSTQVSAGCSSVQSISHVWLFVTPWTTARQASLSITNSWSLPKLMSIESVMPSNHLIFCCPLLLLLSVFPSIRVFSNESALHSHQVAKVLELQLQHQSFQWTLRSGWTSLQSKGLSKVFSRGMKMGHWISGLLLTQYDHECGGFFCLFSVCFFSLFRSYFFEGNNSYLLLFTNMHHSFGNSLAISTSSPWNYPKVLLESFKGLSLPVPSTITCVPSCNSLPGRFILWTSIKTIFSFRFTKKLRKKYGEFPYTSWPVQAQPPPLLASPIRVVPLLQLCIILH